MGETIAKRKARPLSVATRYEDDFYTWLQEQAALLRAGRLGEIDAENIAEELRNVAKTEFKSLRSALALILAQMLKWDYQPERRSRSRDNTIAIQRIPYRELLSENPGLKSRRAEALRTAYAIARAEASSETNLPRVSFPETCPFSWTDILERSFDFDPTGE